MSMNESKLLKEFLEHNMMRLNSKAPGAPTSKKLVNKKSKEIPGGPEENSLEYIIEKKPKAKKVALFLQGMIDEIARENDL
jgi:hypothetical protein